MPYQRVLVPINGGPGDEHALRAAIGLTRRSRGPIYAIYVVEVPQALPLDADMTAEIERGEAAFARCEGLCSGERVQIESEMLQARAAGAAIVDTAEERGVDLIVMSVEGRDRRGEFSIGRTAMYVLRYARCEVCVLRRPLGAATGGARR